MDVQNDKADWSEAEAQALHIRLLARGLRVAVAESLTVGRVQTALGRLSGASAYLAGGLTAYESAAKVRLLDVDAAHAAEVNAVSARMAEEMARGAIKLFKCQIGLATTGYAEPDAARCVAEPFAWVAVAYEGDIRVVRVDGAGLRREAMQMRATTRVLRLLAEVVPG